MSIEKVFEALDDEAVQLLEATKGSDRDNDGNLVPIVSIKDRTNAFEAVIAYAALRAKAEPPKKLTESRFGTIFRDFHGATADDDAAPRRRTRAAKAAPGESGPINGTAGHA